jgi:hypothetical protein
LLNRVRRRSGFSGNIVVGDREEVVVIPAHLAAETTDETVGMTAYEDFVIEEIPFPVDRSAACSLKFQQRVASCRTRKALTSSSSALVPPAARLPTG